MGDFGAVGAWLLLVIVVIGAVLTAVGSVWLASHVVSRDTRTEHNSILSPFLTVVGLIYGALLGPVLAGNRRSSSRSSRPLSCFLFGAVSPSRIATPTYGPQS